MLSRSPLALYVQRLPTLPRQLRRAVRMVRDPELSRSYYPDARRKSRPRMILENLAWVVRHGYPNPYYFPYGLDRAGGPRVRDFPTTEQLMDVAWKLIVDSGSLAAAGVLTDKHVFGLVAHALGHPAPRTLALLRPDEVRWLAPRRTMSYAALLREEPALDAFCKPIEGRRARGVFRLRVDGGRFLADGRETTPAALAGRVTDTLLLQARVEQHEALAALHASSLNTVRIVTHHEDGRATPLGAVLRIGAGARAVDNWSAGGMVVSVDLETGRLRGRGVFKLGYGGAVTHHPDTGVALDGYRIPAFERCLELARAFHEDLGGPPCVGWDVAVTPDGPCLVEGNAFWNANVHMAVDPTFLLRYREVLARHRRRARPRGAPV